MPKYKTAAAVPAAFPKALVALSLVILVAASAPARAEEELVSTMSLMAAVGAVNGIRIVPAPDVPTQIYTQDLAPPQVLEIIRPDMGPITVGRLNSSCVCVRASMAKRSYAAGERAFIEVRNVKPTPADGATYAVFVQLGAPVREVLQYDIFVKSGAAPAVSSPSAPIAASAEPELIVPQADPSMLQTTQPAAPLPQIEPIEVVPSPQPASVAETAPVWSDPGTRPSRRDPSAPQPPPFKYEDITPYRSRKSE